MFGAKDVPEALDSRSYAYTTSVVQEGCALVKLGDDIIYVGPIAGMADKEFVDGVAVFLHPKDHERFRRYVDGYRATHPEHKALH